MFEYRAADERIVLLIRCVEDRAAFEIAIAAGQLPVAGYGFPAIGAAFQVKSNLLLALRAQVVGGEACEPWLGGMSRRRSILQY